MSRVYFIRAAGVVGPIKIGMTDCIAVRFASFANWSPFPLEIAATIDGGRATELALHRYFADAWSHGEWFQPVPALVALVDGLRAGTRFEDLIDLREHMGGQTRLMKDGAAKGRWRKAINNAERLRFSGSEFRLPRPYAVAQALVRIAAPRADGPTPAEIDTFALYISELYEGPAHAQPAADQASAA